MDADVLDVHSVMGLAKNMTNIKDKIEKFYWRGVLGKTTEKRFLNMCIPRGLEGHRTKIPNAPT